MLTDYELLSESERAALNEAARRLPKPGAGDPCYVCVGPVGTNPRPFVIRLPDGRGLCWWTCSARCEDWLYSKALHVDGRGPDPGPGPVDPV